jgi:hypothetical protein
VATAPGERARHVDRRLAAFAIAVIAGHHTGVGLAPLGDVGTTRWADWIDLAVPYAVVGAAAATLAAAGARARTWMIFGAGAIAYTQGHGIHLAANSIGNADAATDTVHLWDEVVGHYVWYGGLAVVVAAVALASDRYPLPSSPWRHALVLLFAATTFTNAVEGGTAMLALTTAAVFVAWGVRRRGRLGWLLVPAYGFPAVALLAWGAYWRGWPQFSELGWI